MEASYPTHWRYYQDFYEEVTLWKTEADRYLTTLEIILQEDRKRRTVREYHRQQVWTRCFSFRDLEFNRTTAERAARRQEIRYRPYVIPPAQERRTQAAQVRFATSRDTNGTAQSVYVTTPERSNTR